MEEKSIKGYFGRLVRSVGNSLPKRTVIITYFLMLFIAMTVIMVSSFLPKMVKSYGKSEIEIGYFAGSVTSALYIGQMLFVCFWRYISNKKGKKATLIISGCCLTVSTLAFGFSNNLYWALVTRFIQGCCLGSNLIYKSILEDVCNDNDFPFTYSIYMSIYLIGGIFAPCIGGFLVFPAEKYPEICSADSVPGKFPILLPMVILVIGLIILIVLTIVYLPSDQVDNERMQLLPSKKNIRTYGGDEYKANIMADESIIYKGEYLKICPKRSLNEEYRRQNDKLNTFQISGYEKEERESIMKNKEHVTACAIYGLFSFVAKGYIEIFPLFAATALKFNGLGFAPSEIATILVITCIVLAVTQLTVMYRITNIYDPKVILIVYTLGLAFVFPLLPSTVAIKSTNVFCFIIFCQMLLTRVLIYSIYIVLDDVLKIYDTKGLRYFENSYSNINLIGEMLGPIVFGSIYSWSLTNIIGIYESSLGFPFNQYFAFYIQSLCAFLVAVLGTMLPKIKKKENKKKETLEEESEVELAPSNLGENVVNNEDLDKITVSVMKSAR